MRPHVPYSSGEKSRVEFSQEGVSRTVEMADGPLETSSTFYDTLSDCDYSSGSDSDSELIQRCFELSQSPPNPNNPDIHSVVRTIFQEQEEANWQHLNQQIRPDLQYSTDGSNSAFVYPQEFYPQNLHGNAMALHQKRKKKSPHWVLCWCSFVDDTQSLVCLFCLFSFAPKSSDTSMLLQRIYLSKMAVVWCETWENLCRKKKTKLICALCTCGAVPEQLFPTPRPKFLACWWEHASVEFQIPCFPICALFWEKCLFPKEWPKEVSFPVPDRFAITRCCTHRQQQSESRWY